jgi:DNA-binding CsgD family transcriptional regulator
MEGVVGTKRPSIRLAIVDDHEVWRDRGGVGHGLRPRAVEPDRGAAGRAVLVDVHGTRLDALSPRERDVLAEIRVGRTNREIVERLQGSTSTVNKHVHQVLRKLRVRNRAEAAIAAAERSRGLASAERVIGDST